MPGRPILCWLAFQPDGSGFAVFRGEVAALRYAVRRPGFVVAKVHHGDEFGPGHLPIPDEED